MNKFLFFFVFLTSTNLLLGQNSCDFTKGSKIAGMRKDRCSFSLDKSAFFVCKIDTEANITTQEGSRYISQFSLFVDAQKENGSVSFLTRNLDTTFSLKFKVDEIIEKQYKGKEYTLLFVTYENTTQGVVLIRGNKLSVHYSKLIFTTDDSYVSQLQNSDLVSYQYFTNETIKFIKTSN